jgi:RHS repeat-associated protein
MAVPGKKIVNYTYANRLRMGLSVRAPNGAIRAEGYGHDTARRLTRVSSLAGTFDYAHQSSIFNLPSSVLLPGAVSGTWSATVPVTGSTTVPATNLTLNGVAVTPHQDNSFAVQESVASGLNTFTALAQDVHGRSSTSAVTVTVIPTNNAYSYDLNGNLLSDGTRNFAYDDENQLIAVWQANAWSNSFAYDGKLRRRIERDSYWNAGTSGWIVTNEIHFVYDGNLVVQERNAANLPQVTYTRGTDLSGKLQGAGGIGGLLARTDNTRLTVGDAMASAYYHCDGNGDVTCLVSPYQEIAAKYLYDPFGNTLAMYGTLATANTYRFSSKEWNGNSGLYYYLYRFYDPNLQRWPNRDPLGESGFETVRHRNVNGAVALLILDGDLYKFVKNGPVDHFDLLGLDDVSMPPGMPSGPMGPGSAACTWATGQAQLALEQAEMTQSEEDIENALYWSLVAAKACKPPQPPPTPPTCPAPSPITPPNSQQIQKTCTTVTIGVVVYWICSEGSRILFPPRNLVPIP